MQFSCTTRHTPAGVVLTLAGDVDLAAHARFQAQVDELSPAAADLTVDCAGVTFLDSMGLRVLIQARQRAVDGGRAFALAAPSGSVLRVLGLAGLRPLFQVVGPVSGAEPDAESAG